MEFFMKYILPVLIVLVLAGTFAFFLSYLSQKLKVDHDERIDHIRANLPGVNCGGCGYAGCDAFAEALFKGEVQVNNCKPASPEARSKISKILGVEDIKEEPKVACVYCNGGNKAVDKASYQGYGDCQSANLLAGGTKVCDVGCMGLSSCVKACQYDAITVDKDSGVAIVDPQKCISCTACFKACPKDLIDFIPVSAKVYVACSTTCGGKKSVQQCKVGCIACGICAKVCPHEAIKIIDNLARIDYAKCTGCGECVRKCPRKTILFR